MRSLVRGGTPPSGAVRMGGPDLGDGEPRPRRSSEALEPVADAAYRFQRTGALAELAPQRADDDFHDVRAARPVVAPDVPQQRFALDGAPFALLEVAKDVEFEPGQVDVASVEHEPATGRVEHA